MSVNGVAIEFVECLDILGIPLGMGESGGLRWGDGRKEEMSWYIRGDMGRIDAALARTLRQ